MLFDERSCSVAMFLTFKHRSFKYLFGLADSCGSQELTLGHGTQSLALDLDLVSLDDKCGLAYHKGLPLYPLRRFWSWNSVVGLGFEHQGPGPGVGTKSWS